MFCKQYCTGVELDEPISSIDFLNLQNYIYSQVLLKRGLISHDFANDTAITVAVSESDIRIATDIPYLTLTDELLGVYWPHYNSIALYQETVNSSPPRQNDCHFAGDIFRCIFVNEKFHILIRISLKFVPKGPNDNNPAWVQIMAWRRRCDKPLFEPILTPFTDAYIRHWWEMS